MKVLDYLSGFCSAGNCQHCWGGADTPSGRLECKCGCHKAVEDKLVVVKKVKRTVSQADRKPPVVKKSRKKMHQTLA